MTRGPGPRGGKRPGPRSGGGRGDSRERGQRGPRGAAGGRGGKQRRSLSMPARSGRIEHSGDPTWSSALSEALRAANQGKAVTTQLTHAVHSYPARMHPATARALCELLLGPAVERATQSTLPVLLDPFCGSGTTLVEARFLGAAAVGVDANPLAVRIARAKTWTALRRERQALFAKATRIAERSLAETKAARRASYEPPPDTVRGAGRDPIAGWFPRHVRRELEFLYRAIRDLGGDASEILSVPLSAILHKVSLRASDTDRTKVDRKIARGQASRLFRARVEELARGLDELATGSRAPIPTVVLGDARRLPKTRADAVITSPPYPGTYDYAVHHELRMAFLELDPRRFRKQEIGARRNLGDGGLSSWRADTREWLDQAASALRSGGLLAAVVGDSVAGRGAVFADREIEALAPDHLELVARASQVRTKLGAREHSAFGSERKREHIVLFRRA